VSKNIVRLRKERKISQLDMATTIGHSSATFFGKAELLVENKHFNLEHIYRISRALDIDVCEFFRS
jgi:DNA-binding XRE family transcriptional regulator